MHYFKYKMTLDIPWNLITLWEMLPDQFAELLDVDI